MSDDTSATKGSVHDELLAFARRVLGSQALATLLLMAAAVGGYRALADDSRKEARDAGLAAVAPVAHDLERIKQQVAELGRDQAESRRRIERTETLSVETAANVRLLLLDRGIKPVTLDAKDGGQ